jgi:hypothetical protein
MSQYELPSVGAGQCMLCVKLSDIHSRTVSETLALLEQMGYQPELRYDETKVGVMLYALLKFDQLDPTQPIPDEHRDAEFVRLCEAFPGEDTAVRYLRGKPVDVAISA